MPHVYEPPATYTFATSGSSDSLRKAINLSADRSSRVTMIHGMRIATGFHHTCVPVAMNLASTARRPHPFITQDTAFFWEAARAHRLTIQRCVRCQQLRHPPAPACANCRSLDWDTVEASGRGTLFSFTIVHQPLTPPFTKPFAVGLIELEEGTRLVTELIDITHDQLVIGMALTVDFIDCDEYLTLPVFRVADGEVR